MYAITGVTGHTGSAAADALLSQGKRVRVIVRDAAKGAPWQAKGAEVAVASLADEGALARALAGVDGAYLLLPPNPTSSDPVGDNAALARTIAAAVRAAKVPHVVLLSSIGAQHPDGTGPIRALHVAERELAATGAALTAVRAAYFQENWGAALGMIPQGVLPSFLPVDLRYPQVATRDIGRTAAAALVEGAPAGARVTIGLAGPRDVAATDVAAAAAEITGSAVAAQDFGLDAVVPTFTQFGLSAEMAGLYRELYAGIISGRVAWQGGDARALRGSVDVADTLRGLLQR